MQTDTQPAACISQQRIVAEVGRIWKPAGRNGAEVMSGPARQVICVLGGPGSGKSTLCTRAAAQLGLLHISTGRLLRSVVQRGGAPYCTALPCAACARRSCHRRAAALTGARPLPCVCAHATLDTAGVDSGTVAEINAAMEAGRPVDDELMIKVLRTAVDGAEPELGLLLDGFP
jgi:hypothetical protein